MWKTRLVKLGQLSRGDRGLLLQAFVLLPIIDWGLTLFGYARMQGMMEKLILSGSGPKQTAGPEIFARAREIVRIVSIAAEHGIFKSTCLRRSLLTWWFLQREGIVSQICFGVRKLDHQLEAHAWVEIQGNVINDSLEIRSLFRMLEDTHLSTTRGL